MVNPRVLVVGGGIAGLATARALLRRDIEPDVCAAIGHRGLHELLRAGILVRLGTTVTALDDQGPLVRAVFDDGSTGDYDLVVGADGVRSWVRSVVFGGAAPRRLGQASWRFLVDGVAEISAWTVRLGRGKAFLTIPLGGGRLYCYADVGAEAATDPSGGDPAELAEIVDRYFGAARAGGRGLAWKMKGAQDRRGHTRRTVEVFVIADLDTLLIALYVELTDRIIPAGGSGRRGPGRPLAVTDAELICLAVAQVLLRYNDERHWLRAAPNRVGHLFPRLLGQSEYNQRLKELAPLMDAALRWLACQTPGSAELLRLLDGTPVGCGQSPITAKRSDLFGYAGYGYESSHSRYYWGVKLMLICTAEGTVTGFGLANPKLMGEREAARRLLCHQPANRPPLVALSSPTRAWLEQQPRRSSPTWSCS